MGRRCAECRRRGRRSRRRHPSRRSAEDLRAVLHDEGARPGNGARALDLLRHRRRARRPDRGRQHTGGGERVSHRAPALRRTRRPYVSEAKIKVLVAEDEVNLGQILSNFLTGRGCAVRTVTDGRAAIDALRAEAYDVALLDIVMPELDGLEVLKQVRAEADPPEVIIITGNGTIETAISAMKLGAYDYMAKPYRMAEIDVLVRRAWEKRRLARENVLLQSQLERAGGLSEIDTQYAPLQAVLDVVAKVAPSDSAVLITGESGTGKELIAAMLHRLSVRAGPFVDVSCASLSEGMLESELFGHERGAFPGAEERKLGLMELAAGGTLFLDGIAELSP